MGTGACTGGGGGGDGDGRVVARYVCYERRSLYRALPRITEKALSNSPFPTWAKRTMRQDNKASSKFQH